MSKQNSLCDFMRERHDRIMKNDLNFFPAPIQGFLNRKHPAHIAAVAATQAEADRSDPFVRDRVASSLMNGSSSFHDYQARFTQVKERRLFGDIVVEAPVTEVSHRTLP